MPCLENGTAHHSLGLLPSLNHQNKPTWSRQFPILTINVSSLVKGTYFYFLQIIASQFCLSPFLNTCYICGFLVCQCAIFKVFLSYYRGPTTLTTLLQWFSMCAMDAHNQKLGPWRALLGNHVKSSEGRLKGSWENKQMPSQAEFVPAPSGCFYLFRWGLIPMRALRNSLVTEQISPSN